MGQPKVSVIIPVYNTEKYLRECLDSVVNQTLRDIEIICVDDGSTDGSLEILHEYAAKDSRFSVFSQENSGQSVARNVAMKCAHGKYFFFLDSDDYLETVALERMAVLADAEELDVVVCGRTIHYERDDLLRELPPKTEERTPVQSGIAYMREAKNRRYYSTTATTKLVLRELVENYGISFPEGMIHEDALFIFLVFMAASRVVQIPDELYGRRIREGSTMTTPVSHKNVHGYFGGALGMLEYASHGPYEPDKEDEIWRALEERINNARKAYMVISEEERAKLIFSRKRDSVLFQKLIADNYLAFEAAKQKKEADKLRQELEAKEKVVDKLQRDLNGKEKEADILRRDLDNKEKETNATKLDLEKQKKCADTLQYDLDCVHNSVSFRFGRAATWLPRKVRGGVWCLRDHGIGYTVRRLLYHMGLWKDEEEG